MCGENDEAVEMVAAATAVGMVDVVTDGVAGVESGSVTVGLALSCYGEATAASPLNRASRTSRAISSEAPLSPGTGGGGMASTSVAADAAVTVVCSLAIAPRECDFVICGPRFCGVSVWTE